MSKPLDLERGTDRKVENIKAEIIPYLSFGGNCEEAVNAYIKVFGGEILYMSHWSENNWDVKTEQIGKVMHTEFIIGSTCMAAGDSFDCTEKNTAIKLMIHMDTEAEALYTIYAMAEGGTILLPLQPDPESDNNRCICVTKDRFGFTWIITCPNPANQFYSDGIIFTSQEFPGNA